jgi:serine protease Do
MKRAILLCLVGFFAASVEAGDLPATIREVKPSVVGVGTYMVLRQQQDKLMGTGFVVGGGGYAVTNSHVVPEELDEGRREAVAVYIPAGGTQAQRRPAKVVRRDPAHDLCLLRFQGPPTRALRLGRADDVEEGESIAFTGFPILNAIGLHPVTHRGIVSAITPYVMPVSAGSQLRPDVLRKLARPFQVFQLDATAYPGNSGSPVYELESGRVVGIINSVFIKQTKEMAITDPSGITYAIPVTYLRKLLDGAGVKY